LRLPDPVLDAFEAWGAEELRGCRRLGREQLHVTLAFLGRRPRSDLPSIVEALDGAAAPIQACPLEPLRWRETQAVGMVVLADPTGRAALLADTLQARLEELRVYRREHRPWLPHVTVARFRARPRLDPPLPPVRTFVPSDAAAFLSELHPTGARHTVLHAAPLGQEPEAETAQDEQGGRQDRQSRKDRGQDRQGGSTTNAP
jgi:2'-5' RNA ligase